MTKKTLYVIRTENRVTVTPDMPEGWTAGETRIRLIADDGMILTDGTNDTPCIDVTTESEAEGYTEKEMPVETENANQETEDTPAIPDGGAA